MPNCPGHNYVVRMIVCIFFRGDAKYFRNIICNAGFSATITLTMILWQPNLLELYPTKFYLERLFTEDIYSRHLFIPWIFIYRPYASHATRIACFSQLFHHFNECRNTPHLFTCNQLNLTSGSWSEIMIFTSSHLMIISSELRF